MLPETRVSGPFIGTVQGVISFDTDLASIGEAPASRVLS